MHVVSVSQFSGLCLGAYSDIQLDFTRLRFHWNLGHWPRGLGLLTVILIVHLTKLRAVRAWCIFRPRLAMRHPWICRSPHTSSFDFYVRCQCECEPQACHTFLFTPYFSWKISHHQHHMKHASIEHDEPYIPKTRSGLGIPAEGEDDIDYEEYFGDTPIYTLFMLIRQQLFAFPAYLGMPRLLYLAYTRLSTPPMTPYFSFQCVWTGALSKVDQSLQS